MVLEFDLAAITMAAKAVQVNFSDTDGVFNISYQKVGRHTEGGIITDIPIGSQQNFAITDDQRTALLNSTGFLVTLGQLIAAHESAN